MTDTTATHDSDPPADDPVRDRWPLEAGDSALAERLLALAEPESITLAQLLGDAAQERVPTTPTELALEIARGAPSSAQNITQMRPFSLRCAIVSVPLPCASR